MIYRDYDGESISEEAFRAIFGNFTIEQGEVYIVRELQAITGPTVFRLTVLDEEGAGVPGLTVTWFWPDGQNQALTNTDGYADFGMGDGAYYWPDKGEAGPHWVELGATTIRGIGMLGGTNHNHFNAVLGPPGVPSIKAGLLEALVLSAQIGQLLQEALP